MITIRNIVVFVGTVTASGLAGSYTGFLPGHSHSRHQVSGSGGVVQLNIGEGCPASSQVANEYPGPINEYRQLQGCLPVGYDLELSAIAAARLSDMRVKNYVGVINSRGYDIASELHSRNVPFSDAAIIVFKGCLGSPADNQRAIEAWKNDSSTKQVLENQNWDDIGSASEYVTTPRTGGQKGYFLQVVVFRKK